MLFFQQMVAASEQIQSITVPLLGRGTGIFKPRGAATTPGLFFSSPTTEQTAMQPGGNRARCGEPMQRVRPGDRLPIESTGVVSHQKPSPVDAVGVDARPGFYHRSSPGQRRAFCGGRAMGLGSVCLAVPPTGGYHAPKLPPFALQMLRICSTPRVRNDSQNNPAQAGNAVG